MKSADIKKYVMDQGADLVSLVNVQYLLKCNALRPPTHFLPEAKTVIVFALKHTDAVFVSPLANRAIINDVVIIYNELNRIAYRLIRLLEQNRFMAITVPPFYPIEMSKETQGLVGDFSLRHAAVLAGLGFIGRNNLLITRDFGPRIRLCAVITNALFDVDNRLIEKCCYDCNICIQKCHAKAISYEKFDANRCSKVVGGSAGLRAMIKFLINLVGKSNNDLKKAISSPSVWDFYQALQIGVSFGCHVCMSSCPIGKQRNNKIG